MEDVKRPNYKDELRRTLSKKEYLGATKSYDIVGNIAIIDAEGSTAKKIAKAIIATNRNVQTVLRKKSAIKGRYRTREFGHVLGKRGYIARYKENGAVFEFDVRKTFFSPRLAYERQRISQQVRKGENIVVMFAGIGPYAIEIAKQHRNSKVVGIELNKNAYNYMLNNIKINKVANVVPELGDVKRIAKKYEGFADRVVMPLPKSSYDFLGAVLKVAKSRCMVHYYAFGGQENAFDYHTKKLDEFLTKRHRKFRIINKRIVSSYSTTEVEIVLDVQVY